MERGAIPEAPVERSALTTLGAFCGELLNRGNTSSHGLVLPFQTWGPVNAGQ